MPDEKTTKERALEALDTIAYQEKFNAFRVMKNGTHEIRHSSTLAWLLDKREKSHSFGYQFALEFFSEADLKDQVAKDQWKKWFQGDYTVETEVPVDPKFFTKPTVSEKAPEDEGTKDENTNSSASKKPDYKKYIDILIVGEGFTCTIENKFGSSHHDHQCAIYKAYIEETYKGYQNYYIYLDIYKQKFKEIDPKDIEGYDWVGYKHVLTILNLLVENEKTNLQSETKDFLLQYIDILNERYGNYSKEVKRALDEVTADSSLAKEVFNYPNAELNTKEKAAKKIVCGRINAIQAENDKFILEQLKQLVIKDAGKLIEYHDGKASVKEPYGYKLNISNAKKSIGIDLSALGEFMNQIDYTSKFGIYSIRIYCGLGVIKSREWLKYAAKNADYFYSHLKVLADHGWKIKCSLSLIHGDRSNGEPQLEDIIEQDIIISAIDKMKDDIIGSIVASLNWTQLMNDDGSVNEESALFVFLREFFGKNAKKYKDMKKCVKKCSDDPEKGLDKIEAAIDALEMEDDIIGSIFASLKKTQLMNDDGSVNEECALFVFLREIFREESNKYQYWVEHIKNYYKDSTNECLCFPCTLLLEYQCNDNPLRSNEKRAAFAKTLAEIYREKTIEGLNLFQSEKGKKLGDDFAEKIFNSLT